MSKKQWLLAFVLVDFTALSLYAVYQVGYVGFFDAMLANIATVTATVDLVIALSLINIWIWNDAKSRGMSPLPYLLLSVVLGSVGPLVYLLRIAAAPQPVAMSGRMAAAR